jgi:hypothetical protein
MGKSLREISHQPFGNGIVFLGQQSQIVRRLEKPVTPRVPLFWAAGFETENSRPLLRLTHVSATEVPRCRYAKSQWVNAILKPVERTTSFDFVPGTGGFVT